MDRYNMKRIIKPNCRIQTIIYPAKASCVLSTRGKEFPFIGQSAWLLSQSADSGYVIQFGFGYRSE